MKRLWESGLFRTAVIILVVAAALLWEFGPKWAFHEAQEWEGVIAEKSREYNYRRRAVEPNAGPEYYDHFWHVETSQGEEVIVEVPYGSWRKAEAGDPVVKSAGERWPLLMTEAAIEEREVISEHLPGF